jgi:hypothetical protein
VLIQTTPQISSASLAVTVLYTSIRPTLAALRQAGLLARDLGASIRILNVRAVPYPLPLDKPPANSEVLAGNIRTLADGLRIPTHIEICHGRDVVDALLQSLHPNSIVLIGAGARRTWWPSKERRWAKQLNQHGHHAIVVTGPASDHLPSRL